MSERYATHKLDSAFRSINEMPKALKGQSEENKALWLEATWGAQDILRAARGRVVEEEEAMNNGTCKVTRIREVGGTFWFETFNDVVGWNGRPLRESSEKGRGFRTATFISVLDALDFARAHGIEVALDSTGDVIRESQRKEQK